MASLPQKLNLEKGHHELRIGKSFGKDSKVNFHTVRYDFKPASVDTNEESTVLVGGDGAVEVTVPHVPGAGTRYTVYKGNKRPLQKECVLIINHDTGEITLEKLSYAIQLKKTRSEMSRMESNAKLATNQRPVTPIEKSKSSPIGKAPMKPTPTASSIPSQSSHQRNNFSPNAIFAAASELESEMQLSSSSSSSSSESSSGSSSSSSESDDSEDENTENKSVQSSNYGAALKEKALENPGPTTFLNTLSQDLRLSDSSDADSD